MTLENTTSPEVETQLPAPEVQVQVQGAEGDKKEGAVTPEVTTPETTEPEKKEVTPKTYTEDEWRKFQSAKDSEVARITRQQQDTQKQLDQILKTQKEAEYNAFLKSVEDAGGDVNAAQQVIARTRQVDETAFKLAQRETELNQQSAILVQAAKNKTALDLIGTYSLDKGVLEQLLNSETSVEMENKALKLHVAKLTAAKTPVTKIDSGVGSTKGRDTSHMSDSEKMGLAIEEASRK